MSEKDVYEIDIVIPLYNEGSYVEKNILDIHKVLVNDEITHRFILVDDGSTDETWESIVALSTALPNIKGISFSRNFGKEAALAAGLMETKAALTVIMDGDMQHPPAYIKTMLSTYHQNPHMDMVECVKENRGKETFFYRLFATSFYKILNGLSKVDLLNSSDFKLLTKEVIEAWKEIGDTHLFIRGMLDWVGFEKIQIPFVVEERAGGKSKFSLWQLIKMATNAIISFSSTPLYLTMLLSGIFFIFAVILGVQTLYNKFTGLALDGFSTVILLILISGSAILFSIGLIGMYISKIYDEVKHRPRYIIKDTTAKEDK